MNYWMTSRNSFPPLLTPLDEPVPEPIREIIRAATMVEDTAMAWG
jgi:hypothetical protein